MSLSFIFLAIVNFIISLEIVKSLLCIFSEKTLILSKS